MDKAVSRPLRLLVVDDSELVRTGARVLLDGMPGLAWVGTSPLDRAAESTLRFDPDVVLIGLHLPEVHGLGACREILSAGAKARALFLAFCPPAAASAAVVLSNADGYIPMEADRAEFGRAIAMVAAGRPAADWDTARSTFAAAQSDPVQPRMRRRDDLSPQESRILALVVEGKTNREIASTLGLSDKTVKSYLSNAFQKLQVSRRTQAAAVFMGREVE